MLQNKDKDQITNGLLSFALLSALSRQDQYGVELLTNLQSTPFTTQAGTLYPLLNRLQRRGLITHSWVESPSGPPRKYYRLTISGQKHLKNLRVFWSELSKQLSEEHKNA